MKILLSGSHVFPAHRAESAGLTNTRFPSGSAYVTHDLLCKGLAELGHDVTYLLRNGALPPLPDGVKFASEFERGADVHHSLIDSDEYNYWKDQDATMPRVVSCHIDPRIIDRDWGPITDEWIFVSKSLANSLGKDRFVWNGIDPSEYIYSDVKQDFYLFMTPIDWAKRKGFDIAVSLARDVGFRLVVAGGSSNQNVIVEMRDICRDLPGVDYVGDVRGQYKAELLAGAKGLIFPTQVNEAFGLGIAEALMSGTPVICSTHGACRELVAPHVGFTCEAYDDYVDAVKNIEKIEPAECREYALKNFHYLEMAKSYSNEYEKEIEKSS